MYKCQMCKAQSEKGEALNKIFKYKKKTYDDGTIGAEILSEKRVCSRCADYMKSQSQTKTEQSQ